jgi:hypothetical protein
MLICIAAKPLEQIKEGRTKGAAFFLTERED